MNQVVSQLNAQNAVQAAGVVDTGSRNVQIRVQGRWIPSTRCARCPSGR
jgi:multidrug efflux pump subunit AcrB